jgi:hypothetical protein
MGDLIRRGCGFRFMREDSMPISHIRNYICNLGFGPDFGMGEEGPEEHVSSHGAELGGLMMRHDRGCYGYKYRPRIEIGLHLPVSERMIADGRAGLARLLPRESPSRPCDLAQLSLIWPYSIVDYDTELLLLQRVGDTSAANGASAATRATCIVAKVGAAPRRDSAVAARLCMAGNPLGEVRQAQIRLSGRPQLLPAELGSAAGAFLQSRPLGHAAVIRHDAGRPRAEDVCG